MTDKEKALELVSEIVDKAKLAELNKILERNQNPGCGGDGSFDPHTWNRCARQVYAIKESFNLC